MSNNISWIGNKVFDSSPSRQIPQPISPPIPTPVPAMFLTQLGDSVPAAVPTQQSSPEPVPPQQANPAPAPAQPSNPEPAPAQPSNPAPAPAQPGTPIVIPPELTQQGPPPSSEKGYIPYYLTSNIGKNVRAEFIIGSNMYADKTGVLIEVGINYFVLNDVNSRTHIMCDLYSVKFVTVLQS